jgi:hypothetical protein
MGTRSLQYKTLRSHGAEREFLCRNLASTTGEIKTKSKKDKHFSNVQSDTNARIFAQCLDNLKSVCVCVCTGGDCLV